MVLVLILWAVVILAVLTVSLAQTTKLDLGIFENTGETVTARWMARSGVYQAVAAIMNDDSACDSIHDPWYDSPQFHGQRLDQGSFSFLAGRVENDIRTVRRGLIDESAKLNLHTAGREMLLALPGMTEMLADTLIRQRQQHPSPLQVKPPTPADTDQSILAATAPADFYLATRRSFSDLAPDDFTLLYGEDGNLNGVLENNENDGDALWPPDNQDDILDTGLLDYLTVYSFDYNCDARRNARLNINTSSIAVMQEKLDLDLCYAIWISDRRGAGFKSLADLLDPAAVIPADFAALEALDPGAGRNTAPLLKNLSEKQAWELLTQIRAVPLTFAVLHRLADRISVTDDVYQEGLININTVESVVLKTLPGMTEPLALAVLDYRRSLPRGMNTIFEILPAPGMTVGVFKQLAPYLTVRSQVFTVRCRAVTDKTQKYCDIEAVLARTQTGPAVLYWHEAY